MGHTGLRRLLIVLSVSATLIGIGLAATPAPAFGEKGTNNGQHLGAVNANAAAQDHPSKNGGSGGAAGDPAGSSTTVAGTAGSRTDPTTVTTTASTVAGSGVAAAGVSAGASGTGSSGSNGNGNPKGNNGTVKIHSVGQDATVDGIDHPNNQPHIMCPFDIVFENFDDPQTVTATLTAQPPSGHGQQVFSQTITLTGSGQGAANNFGGVIHVTSLDLSGLFRQPQQGYHLKLNVAALPFKFKVFWTNGCAAPSVVTTTTTTTEAPTTVAPTTTPTTAGAAVLGEQVTTSTTAGAQVLGEQISRLPRTGFNARLLVIAGLWLLALGLAILLGVNAAGRRVPRTD